MYSQVSIDHRIFIYHQNISFDHLLIEFIRYGLDTDGRNTLQSVLCPGRSAPSMEQGWQETVDASLIYLLKTKLAKNRKDTTTALNGHVFSFPSSLQGLKKHLLSLFDKLEKGAHL